MPAGLPRKLLRSSSASSISRNAGLIRENSRSPASVSATLRVVRLISPQIEPFLDVSKRVAQRRGRDAKLGRRRAKAAVPGDREEGGEVGGIDRIDEFYSVACRLFSGLSQIWRAASFPIRFGESPATMEGHQPSLVDRRSFPGFWGSDRGSRIEGRRCSGCDRRDPNTVTARLGTHERLLATRLDVTSEAEAHEAAGQAVKKLAASTSSSTMPAMACWARSRRPAPRRLPSCSAPTCSACSVLQRRAAAYAPVVFGPRHDIPPSAAIRDIRLGRLWRDQVRGRRHQRGAGGRSGTAGIKVTVVEPGFFRTDFLDESSLVRTAQHIDDYRESVGNTRAHAADVNHGQRGDPRKLASAFIALVKPKVRRCGCRWAATRWSGSRRKTPLSQGNWLNGGRSRLRQTSPRRRLNAKKIARFWMARPGSLVKPQARTLRWENGGEPPTGAGDFLRFDWISFGSASASSRRAYWKSLARF